MEVAFKPWFKALKEIALPEVEITICPYCGQEVRRVKQSIKK